VLLARVAHAKKPKAQIAASYMQLVDHNSSGVHCWWSIKHSIGVRVRLLRVAFGLLAMGGGLGQSEVWIRSGEAVSER
jgi:hypothetical protein